MLTLKSFLVFMAAFLILSTAFSQTQPLYRQTNASLDTRVNALLKVLTLADKISLLGNNSPAIDRLKIPNYNRWTEGLHGVARASEATIFPQAIGMAAAFNPDLLK